MTSFYLTTVRAATKQSLRRMHRLYSVGNSFDIRERLLAAVKSSMKSKDTFTSITLRSALSEVYAADKLSKEKSPSSAIISILRKAAQRRSESAAQFVTASRLDLAEKEWREADILSAFLPPLMSQDAIDSVIRDVYDEMPKHEGDRCKSLGKVLQAFYSKVDKSSVDPDLVKRRVEERGLR